MNLNFSHRCYQGKAKLALIICVVAVSCGRIGTPYIVIEGFPEERLLTEEPVPELDSKIGAYDIVSVGEYLLCAEKHSDCFFTLLDSSFNELCRFAGKGRGHNEYLAPVYSGQYSVENNKLRLSVIDRALARMDDIVIDLNTFEVEYFPACSIPHDANLSVRVLYRTTDGGYCGISDESDCRFFTSGSSFATIDYHDHVMEFPVSTDVHSVSQTMATMHPDSSKIAVAYFNLPQVDIRNYDGTVIRTIFIGKIMKPQDIDRQAPEDFFLQIRSDKKNIYALFEGKDNDAVMVFDWDGNPVTKYIIGDSVGFTVYRNQIITINGGTAEQPVSRYSLY